MAAGATPLSARSASGYVPSVPAAGVPLSTPSVNCTPAGKAPELRLTVGVGLPAATGTNEEASPTPKKTPGPLTNAGACSISSVNSWSTPLPTPLVAEKVSGTRCGAAAGRRTAQDAVRERQPRRQSAGVKRNRGRRMASRQDVERVGDPDGEARARGAGEGRRLAHFELEDLGGVRAETVGGEKGQRVRAPGPRQGGAGDQPGDLKQPAREAARLEADGRRRNADRGQRDRHRHPDLDDGTRRIGEQRRPSLAMEVQDRPRGAKEAIAAELARARRHEVEAAGAFAVVPGPVGDVLGHLAGGVGRGDRQRDGRSDVDRCRGVAHVEQEFPTAQGLVGIEAASGVGTEIQERLARGVGRGGQVLRLSAGRIRVTGDQDGRAGSAAHAVTS